MYSSGDRAELISDLGLRSVTDIPEKYQHIFSAYPCFNAIQSKLLDFLLQTDESLVVSAPTGSGKTVLFELAIIRLLLQAEEGGNLGREAKIVYMAPVKALVSEKYNDWVDKFSQLGMRCLEVTGDSDFMNLVTIKDYQLILTTPEKWDSMTRRWNKTDHLEIIQQVRLFLIDEVHLLNEERRGSTLEAVVSRMKTVQKTIDRTGSCLRFIAVSATIPNGEDLAVWLGTNNRPARFAKIGEDMRPVKLKKVVLGFRHDEHKTSFAFDMSLSYHLKNVVLKYSSGKPTLVFCNSRKSVQTTSSILVKQVKFQLEGVGQQILVDAANQTCDATLADLLKAGIGNHHAGMALADRILIEKLFRDGKLPVLITTSTLAMGVNLPAHLVVIKSTDCYMQSEMKPYTDSQLLQMIGRAGRPQFDTSAVAVIMTKMTDKERFERLVTGSEPIESTLHKNLAELLNAEVVLRTVTDVAVAVDWICSTYFYVRASRCPQRYALPSHLPLHAFHARLHDMCMIELNGLARYKIVEMSEGYDVSPTDEGSLMAKYYIRFDTMKQFMQMKSDESIEGLLQLLSKSGEFADVRLRVVEKRLLNSLNGSNKDGERIRFPIREKIKSKEMKINCLIQATLDGRQVYDNSLNQEAKQIMRIASRLSKGLVQLVWSKGYFRSLLSVLYLSKSLHCSMWENSTFVSRQLPGIGSALSTLLVMAGKNSFRSLLEANPRDLETILNRNPPFGNNLQKDVMCLPMYKLQMRELHEENSVEVKLLITNMETVKEFGNLDHKSALVVGVGGSANVLLHKENIRDQALILRGGEYCLKVSLESTSNANEIEAHFISSSIVGLDVVSKLKMSGSPPIPSLQRQQSVQTCIDRYMKKKKNAVREKSPKIRRIDKNEAKRLTNLSFNMNKFACKAKSKKSILELTTASQKEENAQEMKKSPSSSNSSHEGSEHSLQHVRGADEQTQSEDSILQWSGRSHCALDGRSDIDSGYQSNQALRNSSNSNTMQDITCDDFKENCDPDSEYSFVSNKDDNSKQQLQQKNNVVEQICSKYKGSNSIFKWTKRIPRFTQPKVTAGSYSAHGETSCYEEKLVQGICDKATSRLHPQSNRSHLSDKITKMQSLRKSQSNVSSAKITNYLDKRWGAFTPARSLISRTSESTYSDCGEQDRDSSSMTSGVDDYHPSYPSSFQPKNEMQMDASSVGCFRTPRSQGNGRKSNFKLTKAQENSSCSLKAETTDKIWDDSSSSSIRASRTPQCDTKNTIILQGEMPVDDFSTVTFETPRDQVISNSNGMSLEDCTVCTYNSPNARPVNVTSATIKIKKNCENMNLHDKMTISEEIFETESESPAGTNRSIHPALRSDLEISNESVGDQTSNCLIVDNFELRNTKFYPIFSRRLDTMLETSNNLLSRPESTVPTPKLNDDQVNEINEEDYTAHFSQNSNDKTFENSASDSHLISSSMDEKNTSKEISQFTLHQNQSQLNSNSNEFHHSSNQKHIVEAPQYDSASFSQNCSQTTHNGSTCHLGNNISETLYNKLSRSSHIESREVSNSYADYLQQNGSLDVSCLNPSNEKTPSGRDNFRQSHFCETSEHNIPLIYQNKATYISRVYDDSEVNSQENHNNTVEDSNFNSENEFNEQENDPQSSWRNFSQESCFLIENIMDDFSNKEYMKSEVDAIESNPNNSLQDARKVVNSLDKYSVAVIQNEHTDYNYRYKSGHEMRQTMKLNSADCSQTESHEDEEVVTIDDLLTKNCPRKSSEEPVETRILQHTGNASNQARPDLMKSTIPASISYRYQLSNMGTAEKCQRFLKNQQEAINNSEMKFKPEFIDSERHRGATEHQADDLLIWDTNTSSYISYQEEQTSSGVMNTKNVEENYQNIISGRRSLLNINFPISGSMIANNCNTITASQFSELHSTHETYNSIEMSSEEFSPPTCDDYSFKSLVGRKVHESELTFCSEIKEEYKPDYKLETSALKLLEKCDTNPVDRFACFENCTSQCSRSLGLNCSCRNILDGRLETVLKSGCQNSTPINDCHGLINKSPCIHYTSGNRYSSIPICAGREEQSYPCQSGHQLNSCSCLATRNHHTMTSHQRVLPDSVCSHSPSFPSCANSCHVANSHTCNHRYDVIRKQSSSSAATACSCSCSNSRSYLESSQCCIPSQLSRYRSGNEIQNEGGRDFTWTGELVARPSDDHPTCSSLAFSARTSSAAARPTVNTDCGCRSCEQQPQSAVSLSPTNNTTPF